MNSFYGVLGTSGCRFAGSPLAGAITGFGQYILHWARDRFRERSLKVIYGDTDSLFVLADSPDTDTLFTRGDELCAAVNEDLARFVEEAYEVESKIELEFEKVYTRFYLPRIRHTIGAEDSDVRGRAKGYAGLPLNRDGSYSDLDIKGMEAIRSDWTAAAARLQIELLTLLFQDKSKKEIETHIRSAIRELQSGSRDEDLLYTKRLRKPVASYSKTRPPHVQAAALLPRDEQEGFIEYVMTTAGPQPPSVQTSPLDYPHYIEKQIRPIAEPICEILGIDTTALFDPTNQLSLF
jgi:DNA polymerase-2